MVPKVDQAMAKNSSEKSSGKSQSCGKPHQLKSPYQPDEAQRQFVPQ